MIEEELLLQKGIELELHKFDIQIRKSLIFGVTQSKGAALVKSLSKKKSSL